MTSSSSSTAPSLGLPRARVRPSSLAIAAVLTFSIVPASVAVEEDAVPEPVPDIGLQMTGEDIYQRLLENRFNVSVQDLSMKSGDPGGNYQEVELTVKYMNFRERSKKILSKTIAKYEAPQDVRHLGYLVINKSDGKDDQFIYRPSSRRVRRFNLRGEAIAGTDFSFEDVVPKELEDATYERIEDVEHAGLPAYRVRVTPTNDADSEYTRFEVIIEKEHFVGLKSLYWDGKEVNIKKLEADPKSITMFEFEDTDGMKQIWVATKQRMEHLKLGTYTDLVIEKVESKPRLKPRDFSERQLAASH